MVTPGGAGRAIRAGVRAQAETDRLVAMGAVDAARAYDVLASDLNSIASAQALAATRGADLTQTLQHQTASLNLGQRATQAVARANNAYLIGIQASTAAVQTQLQSASLNVATQEALARRQAAAAEATAAATKRQEEQNRVMNNLVKIYALWTVFQGIVNNGLVRTAVDAGKSTESLWRLENAFYELRVTVGESIIRGLSPFIDGLTDLFDKLSESEAFQTAIEWITRLGLIIGGPIAGLWALGLAFRGIRGVVRGATDTVAGFISAMRTMGRLLGSIGGLLPAIGTGLGGIGGGSRGFFRLLGGIEAARLALLAFLSLLGARFTAAVAGATAAALGQLAAFATRVRGMRFVGALSGLISAFSTGLVGAIKTAMGWLSAFSLRAATTGSGGLLARLGGLAAAFATTLVNAIKSGIAWLAAFAARAAGMTFGELLRALGAVALSFGTTLVGAIGKALTAGAGWVGWVVSTATVKALAFVGTIGGLALAFSQTLVGGIGKALTAGAGWVTWLAVTATTKVLGFVGTLGGLATAFKTTLVNAVLSGLASGVTWLRWLGTTATTGVVSFIGRLLALGAAYKGAGAAAVASGVAAAAAWVVAATPVVLKIALIVGAIAGLVAGFLWLDHQMTRVLGGWRNFWDLMTAHARDEVNKIIRATNRVAEALATAGVSEFIGVDVVPNIPLIRGETINDVKARIQNERAAGFEDRSVFEQLRDQVTGLIEGFDFTALASEIGSGVGRLAADVAPVIEEFQKSFSQGFNNRQAEVGGDIGGLLDRGQGSRTPNPYYINPADLGYDQYGNPTGTGGGGGVGGNTNTLTNNNNVTVNVEGSVLSDPDRLAEVIAQAIERAYQGGLLSETEFFAGVGGSAP